MSQDDDKRSSITRSSIPYTSSVGARSADNALRRPPRKTALGTGRSTRLSVALSRKDRENHTHILGSTGTGKSKLLEYMLRQDLHDRNAGLCLLDPHGSLYDEIMLYASHKYTRLAERIVTFHPARDIDHIVGFNPVSTDKDRMDYFLENLISACLKGWGQHNSDSSPRIARWLENIFHVIMASDATLLETVPLISTAKGDLRRQRLLQYTTSEAVQTDWSQYEKAALRERQTMMEGASNRLRKFLRNETIRLIFGQQNQALDFKKIMDEGKILLVNLNGEDKIDRQNMQLIGTLLVNEIFSASQLRDPRDRSLKPFYFYIDEFAQFITRDIAYSLEEARKRKLFMVLAHQHLAQLKKEDEYLYASVMTNCKNKIIFGGLSVEDSDIMVRELQTGFLDMKSLKHEHYRTRVRHVEERREVRSYSSSSSEGTSESQTHSETLTSGESRSETAGTSVAHGEGRSQTLTVGEAQNFSTSRSQTLSESQGSTTTSGRSKTIGESISDSFTQGHSTQISENRGQTRSRSEGESQGFSQSDTHGQTTSQSSTDTRGWSSADTRGSSFSSGSSSSKNHGTSYSGEDGSRISHSYGNSEGESSSHSSSRSHTDTQSRSRSDTHGSSTSTSHTQGTNRSTSQSVSMGESTGLGRSQGRTQSVGLTRGRNASEQGSHSEGLSESYTRGETRGYSEGYSKSISASEGTSESVTHTQSESTTLGTSSSHASTEGTTTGRSESSTKGESVSYVPFLRPEEVEELASVTFWTKEELLHMKQGELKNQDTAQAFVKIGAGAPVSCQIDRVESVYFHPKSTPMKLERFRAKMIAAHPEYYITRDEAREECRERQIRLLGEEIRFDARSFHDEEEVYEDARSRRDEDEEGSGFDL